MTYRPEYAWVKFRAICLEDTNEQSIVCDLILYLHLLALPNLGVGIADCPHGTESLRNADWPALDVRRSLAYDCKSLEYKKK